MSFDYSTEPFEKNGLDLKVVYKGVTYALKVHYIDDNEQRDQPAYQELEFLNTDLPESLYEDEAFYEAAMAAYKAHDEQPMLYLSDDLDICGEAEDYNEDGTIDSSVFYIENVDAEFIADSDCLPVAGQLINIRSAFFYLDGTKDGQHFYNESPHDVEILSVEIVHNQQNECDVRITTVDALTFKDC